MLNQQEIDRLWEETVGPSSLANRAEFAAALNEATAQARREALEEAVRVCDRERVYVSYPTECCQEDYEAAYTTNDTVKKCVEAIRALAAQPQEGM